MRTLLSIILVLALLLGMFAFDSQTAKAESWMDDFTNPDLQFDPRWVIGGQGQAYPFNGTYAEAVSFTTSENSGWHGPWLKTQISPAADFNVTLKLDCIADYAKETRGRLEVQLLDTAGIQFYSFGWEDTELTNQYAAINLKGEGNQTLFSTGGSVKYTIFTGKLLSLSRASGEIGLYIQGNQGFNAPASSKALSAVRISFYKHELTCTPTYMRLDSISVVTTPATLPTVPLGLAVESLDRTVSLTWNSPSSNGGLPITAYNIYRATEPGASQYLTTVGDVNVYNDTGLTNGQNYYYTLSAVNNLGAGAVADEITAMPVGLPGQPRNLQAVSGNDYVSLVWLPPLSDGGSPITNYSIERGELRFDVSGDSTTFNDTDLKSGTEYEYKISASNALGEGLFSLSVFATPGATLHLPMPPQNLRAQEADSRVVLTWDSPSSNGNSYIVNYTLYRGTSPGSMTIHKIFSIQYEYEDTGLTNGVTYYYSVTATNGVGEGPQSAEVSVTPMAPLPPSEPMQFIINGTQSFVMLEWLPPLSDGGSDITGYKVYRGTSPGQLSPIANLSVVYSYTDTDVSLNRTYLYAISAENIAGEGTRTSELNITLKGADPVILNPDNTGTGIDINLNSTIVTFIAFGVAALAIFAFLRLPPNKSEGNSSENPDEAVDDKADNDGSDKEEEKK